MRLTVLVFICSLFFFTSTFTSKANEFKDRVGEIYPFMTQLPDSAISMAKRLKIDAEKAGNSYAMVRADFIMGYVYDAVLADYGKGIICYLEAIRNAKKSKYQDVEKDLAILFKNCGVIFRKFKSYDLSEEYYIQALEYATINNYEDEIQSTYYNYAGLQIELENYDQAIDILKDYINRIDPSSSSFWKFNNRLGNAYHENGQFLESIEAHQKSIEEIGSISNKSIGYTLHNIGRSYFKLGEIEKSKDYFLKAIEYKNLLSDKSYLFSSYEELGNLWLSIGDYDKSLNYFDKAEELIPIVKSAKYFDLYRSKANALFQMDQYNGSKKYDDLYAISLNQYLELQENLQETDKKYNMDLITKRYFDEVEKQERISSILFYSKLTSGSLLALLLLVIGYYRFEKIRLRKTIEQELISLRLLD